MPKIRLNQRTLEALKVQGKWLTDYWDDGLSGFGVRVAHSGLKTFVVRYVQDGRKRRVTIGPYPAWKLADARDKAKEILYAVDRGEDPQAEKKAERQALTFGELADEYLERHAKLKKRRWKEDERVLRVDLRPHWAKLKAKNIQRRDVNEVLDGIVERGAPIMANRVRALISKIYNFGLSRDLVEHNPCLGVATPAPARQRERVLSDEEIRAVWRVLESEEPVMAATFKLRLLTAQRGVEVLTMRWSDIDGEWWTIPAEVVKNKLSHRVPLSKQALGLLDVLREITGDKQWVFASPRRPDKPISAVQKASARIAEAAKVSFVPHDLRRTAASHMTSIGISRLVVSKILNHVEQGVTAIYDRHSYDGEKREALSRWGNRVEEILNYDPVASLSSATTGDVRKTSG